METLGYYNQYTAGGETAASTILNGAGNANVVAGTFQTVGGQVVKIFHQYTLVYYQTFGV